MSAIIQHRSQTHRAHTRRQEQERPRGEYLTSSDERIIFIFIGSNGFKKALEIIF